MSLKLFKTLFCAQWAKAIADLDFNIIGVFQKNDIFGGMAIFVDSLPFFNEKIFRKTIGVTRSWELDQYRLDQYRA